MRNDFRLSYTAPPSLTPAAVKKLVEKRNDRFSVAVNEYDFSRHPFLLSSPWRSTTNSRLIRATPTSEDPVALLQSAGRDHIPVNPSPDSTSFSDVKGKEKMVVPDPKDRPTVDEVISEIYEQEWYKAQIVERRVFEAKTGQKGDMFAEM